jgi:hypothetical protein
LHLGGSWFIFAIVQSVLLYVAETWVRSVEGDFTQAFVIPSSLCENYLKQARKAKR